MNMKNINGIEMDIALVGLVKSEEWSHFLWNVTIKDKETFSYKTGLGLVDEQKLKLSPFSIDLKPDERKANAIVKKDNRFYKVIVKGKRIDCFQLVKPKQPIKADVMCALLMDSTANDYSFYDWCSEFGYSEDSRKAERIYTECCETCKRLEKLFSRQELATFRQELEESGDY